MRPYSPSRGVVVRGTILVQFALLTVGLFVATRAYAQGDLVPSVDSETPFTEAYNTSYGYRGSAIRMSYKSPAYGLHNDQFSLGLQNRRLTGDGALMLDGQYYLNLEHSQMMGLNVGFGKRWLYQGFLGETARIFGATFWYDGVNTEIDNMFNQVGVSLESLGETWDFRLNTNIIAGTSRQEGTGVPTGEIGYYSFYLSELTIVPIDQAVNVVDFEVARRIGAENIWLWGGGYGLWEKDTDDEAFGGKAGVRGYVYDDLLLQLAVTSDEMFDTKVTFNLIWYPGRSSRRHRERHTIDDRLMEPVIRNNYIALKRDQRDGGNPLEWEDGDLVRVVHVDSDATAPGDGSYESPFTSLDDVYGGSQDEDIILVHADTTYSGEHIVLRDNQFLFGEGGGVEHEIFHIKKYGRLTLPETSPGALAGAVPLIENTTGDVITLGAAATSRDYDDDERYSYNKVSNLKIDGGTRGIVSDAVVGIGEVRIDNMTIEDTTGNAIELTPYVQTIVAADASTSKQVLFSPSIDTVTLTNVGGNGIDIDATTGEISSTPLTESISVTNVTSTSTVTNPDTTGQGISITNNKNLATIDNFQYTGGTMAEGGILLTNSSGGANITESDITGGAGTGISIVNDTASDGTSSGTFTVTDTNITDTGEAAFHIDGGTANVNFAGKITQGSTGAVVKIEGDHTGTASFSEASADDGVISATSGPGLVFGDAANGGADGIYTFNHEVELVGVATGVVMTDSDGTVALNDALIENATTAAVQIDGGSGNLALTGQIVQTTSDTEARTAVSVSGGHDGTVVITEGATSSSQTGNGAIYATVGDGLKFDDADGTYTINDKISLTGTNTTTPTSPTMTGGISITNGSAGTFTFGEAYLTDIGDDTAPAEAAFALSGGTATVNFTGRIVQDGSDNLLASIGGGHTGTVNFNEFTTDEGVMMAASGSGLSFNGADGTYNFNDGVELSGTAASIDIAVSDGTITFSDATVTNTSDLGDSIALLDIGGGTANVNFTGQLTKTSGSGAAVNIDGAHTGTVNFNEGTTGAGVIVASSGAGLQLGDATNLGADGTYKFNDAVTLSDGAVVDIDSSEGTFTFDADSSIANSSGTAFTVQNGTATVTYNGTIDSTDAGSPVYISANSGGTATFAGAITSTGGGISVQNNTGGTFAFTGQVDLDTAANTAVDIGSVGGNTGATVAFSNLQINTTSGTGFYAENGGTIQLTGSNNTVETTTGTGIDMDGVEISSSGAAFKSVSAGNATNQPVNGIVLNDITGSGTFSVGSGGSSAGDGGTIQNTTGSGILITNAAHVSLNNMLIDDTGSHGIELVHDDGLAFNVTVNNSTISNTTDAGIDLNATGTGSTRVTLTSNTINNTGLQGINLNVTDDTTLANISVNNNTISVGDNEAMLLTVGGSSAKTVNFEANNNNFSNNSSNGTLSILAEGNVSLNATVHNNNLFNLYTTVGTEGRAFDAETTDASATLRLALWSSTDNNVGTTSNGNKPFRLTNTAGSFSTENLSDITGDADYEVNGTITNDPGGIPTP